MSEPTDQPKRGRPTKKSMRRTFRATVNFNVREYNRLMDTADMAGLTAAELIRFCLAKCGAIPQLRKAEQLHTVPIAIPTARD